MGYYAKAKVYCDGSHYIAIPHTERLPKPRPKRHEKKIKVNKDNQIVDGPEMIESSITTSTGRVLTEVEWDGKLYSPVMIESKEPPKEVSRKEEFEKLYEETKEMMKSNRENYIFNGLRNYFFDDNSCLKFVQDNMFRKKRNVIVRRVRLSRKVYLNEFNYFCTFTYDDKLHDEESFRKKLSINFKNLSSYKGWKYIGVWERSPEKQRLHFHGLFYIPSGKMPGVLIECKDYSLKSHQMQTTIQNTYFNAKYGRSDFEVIDSYYELGHSIAYLMKYIEKTGEKIVSSRNTPQFFISDILDDDIALKYNSKREYEGEKLILFDDFTCIDDGEIIGKVSSEVIARMPKAN